MSTRHEIQAIVAKQEAKDRAIATAIYSHLKGIQEIKSTQITDPVDLYCKLQNGKELYTEIKEMKGNYPNFLLKVDKHLRMINFVKAGQSLFYMVLNNGHAYIFNMRTIDWTKVKRIMLTQKKTQVDPDSEMITVPTYLIPRSQAIKVLKISDFYADNKQTQEEASQD